jgi:two-component sensor histidine kinase
MVMPTQSYDTIRRLLAQQEAVANFGTFAFSATDLTAVLNKAAEMCAQSLGTRFCKICQYRPEHNDLMLVAGYGWDEIHMPFSTADDTTPGGRAFVSKKPLVCYNLANETGFILPEYYKQNNVVSSVNVLIPSAEVPDCPTYGVLEVDHTEERKFDKHDVNFLTGFANVLAEAVATRVRLSKLHAALEEKDLLSRELQHRVRNNLHLIYSMLNIEGDTNPAAADIFRAIASRVQALATVYDHLLGSGLSKTIAFDQYLERLCDILIKIHPGRITLTRNPFDRVMVDLDTATVMGIAATELIGNSYRHAFPSGDGTITVSLNMKEGEPTLIMADDGIGINLNQGSKRHGLGLVRRLAQQIGAKVEIETLDQGTQCSIILPLYPASK